jgi:hypothetical protein
MTEPDDSIDSQQYRIFNDLESLQKPVKYVHQGVFIVKSPSPTLDEITTFYRDVFTGAQMEADCIIISLIYVERLIKMSEGALRPCADNWRSLLFSCMVLASKVWDDMSMWNADFSRTCPAGVKFSIKRTNELELGVLSALQYMVKVPASEYAKYYFLLRSMLIKSGLGIDDLKTSTDPLDVEGARRLQQVSALYQSSALMAQRGAASATKMIPLRRPGRSKSVGDKSALDGAAKGKVGLEYVVQM